MGGTSINKIDGNPINTAIQNLEIIHEHDIKTINFQIPYSKLSSKVPRPRNKHDKKKN